MCRKTLCHPSVSAKTLCHPATSYSPHFFFVLLITQLQIECGACRKPTLMCFYIFLAICKILSLLLLEAVGRLWQLENLVFFKSIKQLTNTNLFRKLCNLSNILIFPGSTTCISMRTAMWVLCCKYGKGLRKPNHHV